jgi:hypothetical protein
MTTDLFAARVEAVRAYNLAQKAYAATKRDTPEADAARLVLHDAAKARTSAEEAHEATLTEDAARTAAIEIRKLTR